MTDAFVLATNPMKAPAGLEGAVYAVGNFDGFHLGHQAVIRRSISLANELAAPAALLTFEPHPADFFAARRVVFRLTPSTMKARIAERLGLDGIVILSFDAALAGMSAEDFVQTVLVDRLKSRAVVVGWDFHFGKGRAGSPAFLVEAGKRHGFAVEVVAKVENGDGEAGRLLSSAAVRRALEEADVDAAARMIGRNYAV